MFLNHDPTYVWYLKAYDSVWRPLLFKKLERLGFGGKTIQLIKSMYKNDSLKFLINGHYSDEIFLTQGVKQGKFPPTIKIVTNNLH